VIELDQVHRAPSQKTGYVKNPIWTWWHKEWITWKTNSDWVAIKRIELTWQSVEERTISLLNKYGWKNTQLWFTLSEKYWYRPEFVVCLAQTETWLWWQKKTKHNYFNCWNNDRGDTETFSNLEHSFRWLHYSCLDGTYLKHKQTLSHLNPRHKDSSCNYSWDNWCQYVYASSKENRWNNMQNCLSNIHQKQIDMNYRFRL